MLRKMLLAVLASLLLPAMASAQSSRKVLEDFGFFGNWAPDCSIPATPTNIRRHAYNTQGGEVHFTESVTLNTKRNIYAVFEARRIAPDKVLLRIQLNGKDMQNLTMKKENGRLRTIYNEKADGDFLVKDGIVVSTGKETPWLTYCNDKD